MKKDEWVLVKYRDPYGQCSCCFDCYSTEYEDLGLCRASEVEAFKAYIIERRPYLKADEISVEELENWSA